MPKMYCMKKIKKKKLHGNARDLYNKSQNTYFKAMTAQTVGFQQITLSSSVGEP